MKTLLLLITLLPTALIYAQRSKNDVTFFVYDENWKGCEVEKAKYLGCFEKLSDTAYQMKYYNFSGPIIAIETYKDKDRTILNGSLIYYGEDGKIDSTGHTINGRKNDWWYYYTDSSTLWLKEKYNNGKLLERMDAAAMKEEWEKEKQKLDTTLVRDEIEASFSGGQDAWVKYIQKNIEFPDRARSLKKEGTLIVQFIVGRHGNVEDAEIFQSVEYSIDEEALRLIRKSPKWKPAIQDGKYVKAYRRQPLTFKMP